VTTGLRIGVHLPQFGAAATREGVVAVARMAEEAGLDSVWVGDHIAFPQSGAVGYPYPGGGLPMGRAMDGSRRWLRCRSRPR
jgi:alkanesulfonate monooxygenase SsuD/methylene tetrahydromethanopterin reductase-like flavin-dependent oxidoreductase (luciferase family)